MTPRIALIADGRLILAGLDGRSKRHECDFASQIEARQQRSEEKNSWMGGDERGGGGMGMPFSRSSVWGGRGQPRAPSAPPRIVAVAGGERPDSIVYALWTGVVGAVLEYDFREKYERRVFHRERFQAEEFDRHARDGRIVCRFGDRESSNLAVLDPDGRNARLITEGDSYDAAPAWAPGEGERVVYHAAGLSRDPAGYVRGLGPAEIHLLDLASGELETLAASPGHDLLAPHLDASGGLYYIRRPYEGPEGLRPSIWVTLKDAVLFPFRLFRAMVDFFQIFSNLVSRRPLTSAGGPKIQGPEPVRMWIHGRMLDAQQAAKKGLPDGALAPADWELVHRTAEGRETVVARHVVAYDLSPQGELIWSDGRNVHVQLSGPGGEGKRRLLSEPLIGSVKWLEPAMVPAE